MIKNARSWPKAVNGYSDSDWREAESGRQLRSIGDFVHHGDGSNNGGWYRSDSVGCASDPACRDIYYGSRPDMDARRHRVVTQ